MLPLATCPRTLLDIMQAINNIAAVVAEARRKSLAKAEKENDRRESFCKDSERRNSRRGSQIMENLCLGFSGTDILQGRRKSFARAAGA